VFSSPKLGRAAYEPVAFRFIAGNEHPGRDAFAAFRRLWIGSRSPRNWRGARSTWRRLPAPSRRSRRGRSSAMRSALRKQTPELVFGIIKSVRGFLQFLLRGLDQLRASEPL